ncbi:hypothetical protein [Acinetobacter dispersus]|uniref:hypothetical protein n=1 Tax=Acinetobacter dispersus TaxID=70348 RepID=UPI001F4AD532|nr:hypothetical protein [Acinetobacter dispersus]MCH7391814.1 hypothetical protein [Acinetobacter dispersus]
MPAGAAIAGGAGILGSVLGSKEQSKAAGRASDAQVQSTQMAIDEQRRQSDELRKLMQPYLDSGYAALGGQQDLLGLNGMQAQQNAINGIQNSAEFQTYLDQGNNNLRQNASATGGLRGGNTQAALGQFSGQLLNQMINQHYANLGGLTALGQNSAAGVGNAGMQTAGNIGNLLQQSGAAQAGNYLAQGQANANMYGGIAKGIGGLGSAYDAMGGWSGIKSHYGF